MGVSWEREKRKEKHQDGTGRVGAGGGLGTVLIVTSRNSRCLKTWNGTAPRLKGMMGIYGAVPGSAGVKAVGRGGEERPPGSASRLPACVCLAARIVICGWIVDWAAAVFSSPSCLMPAEQKKPEEKGNSSSCRLE